MTEPEKAAAELRRDQKMRDEWRQNYLKKYKLKPMKWSDRNILAVLKSAGADHLSAKMVQSLIVRRSTDICGTFDHSEMYGRDRCPLLMIGHPYGIDTNDIRILYEISKLGLDASVDSRTWYGFGTVQVAVYNYNKVYRSEYK